MANAIQKRNDEFRLNVLTQPQRRGKCIVTRGFDALDVPTKKKAIEAVKNFSDFTEDNDPHREHDFGEIVLDGTRIFWKIDYYESEKTEYGTGQLPRAKARGLLSTSNSDNCLAFVQPNALFGLFLAS